MAATTTIVAAIAALKAKLAEAVGVSPGGSRVALRAVVEGEGLPSEAPIPFLALRVMSDKAGGHLDGARYWKLTVKFRILFHISASGAADTDASYYLKQVEELVEVWNDGAEIPAGMAGGENPEWAASYGVNAAGELGLIESIRTFQVRVAREAP